MSTDRFTEEPQGRPAPSPSTSASAASASAATGSADREGGALQQRVRALEAELRKHEETEAALRHELDEARAGRAKAEATDAFKEVFMGILGHDLRNPLNTVLTTARLMTMRNELAPESHKRMERVVVAGLRMQRMLEQLLDLTKARLAGGIAVSATAVQDVEPIVASVVAEAREAHAERTIDWRGAGSTTLKVDTDRFAQVVSDLVGNAVMHGDPDKPISVALETKSGHVSVSVHNFGTPIDAELMPILFEPFKRGQRPKGGRPGGLGLGLFITERLVHAHGGALAVTSSPEAGTLFEARFPQT